MFLEVGNLFDPNQNIHDSQSQHCPFEERIGQDWPELRVTVQDVVVLPNCQPGEKQEKESDLQRIDDVDNGPEPAFDRRGTAPGARRQIWLRESARERIAHANQDRPRSFSTLCGTSRYLGSISAMKLKHSIAFFSSPFWE